MESAWSPLQRSLTSFQTYSATKSLRDGAVSIIRQFATNSFEPVSSGLTSMINDALATPIRQFIDISVAIGS